MIGTRRTARQNTWPQAWSSTAVDPQQQLILALLLLNGLSVDEIQALSAAYIDVDAGWITTASGKYPMVEQVRQRAAQLTTTDGALFVVLDLRHVEFMDSAALAALVNLLKHARQAGGDVEMIPPESQAAHRILTLTKFDRVFKMIDSPAGQK